MGLSVWLCLCGTIEPAPELTLASWADFTAVIGLGYALGFAAFVLPTAGVGVREYVLSEFLIPYVPIDDPVAARVILTASALLLRCAWTLSELAMAGVLAAVVSPTRKRGHQPGERMTLPPNA